MSSDPVKEAGGRRAVAMDPSGYPVGPPEGAGTGSGLPEASQRLEEPGWLGQWRVRAHQLYLDTPMPIRASHLWRYTDPAQFALSGDALRAAFEALGGEQRSENPSTSPGWPEELEGPLRLGDIAGAGYLVDGGVAGIRLDPEATRAGVVLTDLQTAARESPDALRRVLGTLVAPEFGKLEALNAAVFSGGFFLHVPRGVVLDKPIHVVHRLTRTGVTASRLVVLVEDGASVTLVDDTEGGPATGTARLYAVTELVLGTDARTHIVSLQALSGTVTSHVTQRALLGRNASYLPVMVSFGAALAKIDAGAVLEGAGCESEMTGFLFSVGRQRFDHHTVHHHRGPHTRSNLDFKTVLKDRSRSAYTGLIRIEPEASFSEAYQENRNLLLSKNCRADSIPELEILTEEVQCKHGATVGPVDPAQLFYLMSRSISEHAAVNMIVEGHFEPAMKRLPSGLQDRLRLLLQERLRKS